MVRRNVVLLLFLCLFVITVFAGPYCGFFPDPDRFEKEWHARRDIGFPFGAHVGIIDGIPSNGTPSLLSVSPMPELPGSWLRIGIPWDAIEPGNNSYFTNMNATATLDDLVQQSNVKGKKILFAVSMACTWGCERDLLAEERLGISPIWATPLVVNDWLEFITRLLDRYRGNISLGAVEVSLGTGLIAATIENGTLASRVAELGLHSARAIKDVDEELPVIIQSIVSGTSDNDDVDFSLVDEMFRESARPENIAYNNSASGTAIDGIGIVMSGAVETQETTMLRIAGHLDLLNAMHGVSIDPWVVSFSFPSRDDSKDTLNEQANDVARISFFFLVHGAKVVIYGSPLDNTTDIDIPNVVGCGLLFGNHSSKPSFVAFDTISRLVSGGEYPGYIMGREVLAVDVNFQAHVFSSDAGDAILVCWNRHPVMVKFFTLYLEIEGTLSVMERVTLDGAAVAFPVSPSERYFQLSSAGTGVLVVKISPAGHLGYMRVMNVFPDAAWIFFIPVAFFITLATVTRKDSRRARPATS